MRHLDNPKVNVHDTSPKVLKRLYYATLGNQERVPDRDGRKLDEQHRHGISPVIARENRNDALKRKSDESIIKAGLDFARKLELTTTVTQDEMKTLTNARAELEAQARHKKPAPKPKKFGKSSGYGSKPKIKK